MSPTSREIKEGALAILLEALKRVKTGWTQDVEARDSDGKPCYAVDDNACQWSLAGAMDVYYPGMTDIKSKYVREEAFVLIMDLLDDTYTDQTQLPYWNDAPDRRKRDVVALLAMAITQCEESL